MAEQRIVYKCSTLLSLMNSIVAQLTVNKGIPADMVLEDTTDFSEIAPRLMAHSLFENIYLLKILERKTEYRNLNSADRRRVDRKPSSFFSFPDFTHTYTDYCTNLDSYTSKLFYYGLVEKGMCPNVHFVGEGTSTYALDFLNTKRDNMDHAFYKDKAFLKNVRNVYLYQPDLYTGGSKLVTLVPLPLFSSLPSEVHEIIDDVFGTAVPVREKLIFFEGTFWGDGMLVNEMDLFLAITQHVGKENVIVKRHPRNAIDRFTPMGFKVMPQQNIPWEIMIKNIDLSRKALVSVASFTCFSAMEMYGRISRSVLLKDLLRGRVPFLKDPGYQRFFKTAEKYFNGQERLSWTPRSINELKLVLDIVGEKIGGWN